MRALSLAASMLIFAAVIGWLVANGSSSGGTAFAEMLRLVSDVRTAEFKARAEWTDAQPPRTVDSTYYVQEPNHVRVDQGKGDERYIMIIDLQRKQMLGLHPAKMTAVRSNFELRTGNKMTSVMRTFHELSADSAEFLGREKCDGRETLKYHGQIPTGYYWLWIGADDHLPVKMVTSGGTADLDKSSFIETFSDFRWNVPLDADLFSLEIPESYIDMTQPEANETQKATR